MGKTKLSIGLGLLLAAAVVVVVGVITGHGGKHTPLHIPHAGAAPWFAPYADVTLATVPDFQDPAANPSRHVVLGFIVGGALDRCTPTWGGLFTLDQAATLNTRIRQARAANEEVLVSFGGAQGSELAVSCADSAKLAGAYQTVVRRYNLSAIDLDIEGFPSLSPTVNARRAQAIAAVQQAQAKAGKPLAAWLTLAVSPSGLEPNGVAAIQQMLSAGVKIAGVNVMTFDYGPLAGQTILRASESALTATAAQLQSLYRSSHISFGANGVWPELGATIMEGRTDTAGQVWNISDAQALYGFAFAHHLGRLFEWSLSRDQKCSGTQPQPSDYCSGVPQQSLEFSEHLLGRDALRRQHL
ncbi:MAG: chitinase [Solirubrobacteraceae bacterium]